MIKYVKNKLIEISENPSFDLNEEIYLDELDLVWLVMEFEKDFNVVCMDDDIENLKTFGDMIKYFSFMSGIREKKLERINKLF